MAIRKQSRYNCRFNPVSLWTCLHDLRCFCCSTLDSANAGHFSGHCCTREKGKNTFAVYILEFKFTCDEYAKLNVIANARNTSPSSVTPFHISRSLPTAPKTSWFRAFSSWILPWITGSRKVFRTGVTANNWPLYSGYFAHRDIILIFSPKRSSFL